MPRALALLTVAALFAAGCSVDEPALVDAPQAVASLDQAPAVADPTPTPLATPTPAPVAEPVTLRLAVQGEVEFDPLAADVVDPQDMVTIDLVYDGLTAWDVERGTWEHSLARRLEVSEDGLVWTVTLADRTFSDGTPVTAGDVVRTLDRVRAQPLSIAATRLEIIGSYEAMSDAVVRLELGEPFAALPALLSSPVYGVVPAGALDGTVGSGPMHVEEGALVAAFGATTVDRVELIEVADAADAHGAGTVDLAFVAADDEASLVVPAAIEAHYALNIASPHLRDTEVRRTIVAAVGRAAVARAGFGPGATAIDRMIPSTLACAAPCGGDDPADPPTVESLSIAYVDEPTGREAAMAEALAAELAEAGIVASAMGLDLDGFVELVSSGGHDIARTGWVGLFPSADSQLAPYVSDSPDNISGFADDAFDVLIEAARTTGGAEFYDEAWARLHDEAVVIPIARLQVRVLIGDRVESIGIRHDGTFDLAGVVLAD